MSVGGDAAGQMVRDGVHITESAVKLAGLGAKNLAALLLALLRDNKKLKGKTGINKLIQADKQLSIFQVKKSDLGKFKKLAEKYGVLFAPVYNRTADKGICDVLVKAEDAAQVNRILEILKYPAPEKSGKNAESRVPQEHSLTERGSGWLTRQMQRRNDPVKKYESKTSMLEGLGAEMLAALCLHVARENCREQGASELSRLLGSGMDFLTVEISSESQPIAEKRIRALGLPVQFQNFEDGKCQMIARSSDAPLINRIFTDMAIQPPMKQGQSKSKHRKKNKSRQSVRDKVETTKKHTAPTKGKETPAPKRDPSKTTQDKKEKPSVKHAFAAAKKTLAESSAPSKSTKSKDRAR